MTTMTTTQPTVREMDMEVTIRVRTAHYVTFYSPGSLFAEQSSRPVAAWDPKKAVALAEAVVERHGARPYGFSFSTVVEADPIEDGHGGKLHVLARGLASSGVHYMGAKLVTYDEVAARNDPDENILRSNMSDPDCCVVAVVTNGFKMTRPFAEEDVVVAADGTVVERGDDPKWVAYRAARRAAEEKKYRGDRPEGA